MSLYFFINDVTEQLSALPCPGCVAKSCMLVLSIDAQCGRACCCDLLRCELNACT